MVKFLALLNYEISRNINKMLILCFGVIITPVILISSSLNDYSNIHMRFEAIYENSGCVLVFGIYFAAVCGKCIQSYLYNYSQSKSIYTLITLPVKREAMYFSKLVSYLIYFMIFYCAQILSIFITYGMYEKKVSRFSQGIFEINNGLFLAFVRSDFIRMIFPAGPEGIVTLIVSVLTVISTIYYSLICFSSRKFVGVIPVLAALVLVIRMVAYKLNYSEMFFENISLGIFNIILIAINVGLIIHGIILIKKGAVA